jgi:drug/metabolite transporter (DMT)-like permease
MTLPHWLASKEMRAIVAMCVAMALFVGNDIFNKMSRVYWPTGQILCVRGMMAVSLMLIWVRAAGLMPQLKDIVQFGVIRRGALEGCVAILFIMGLGMMPLSDALAILMASTLIGTALSVPLLDEKVGWRRWTAILVGFCGMLLVVQPSGSAGNIGGILMVLCAIGVAFRDISTRFIPKSVPSLIITLGTALGTFVAGTALMMFEDFAPFDPWVIFYLFCSACFIICGNYASVLAFREVEIAVVSPFRYTSMIWGTLASGLVFSQWPSLVVCLGMALIVGSGLYTLHRERIRMRQSQQLMPSV